jgi:hypothetical protein
MFVLVAFYSAMVLKLADSKSLLPLTEMDKDVYIYGISMFIGILSSVFIPLLVMLIGFLTKCFSVQWLPVGKSTQKSYLSVLVVGFQEFVLLGVCINIFALAIYTMGFLGGWFVTFNYFIFLTGFLIYPLIGLSNLIGVAYSKAVISYSIAILLMVLIGYVFISTR